MSWWCEVTGPQLAQGDLLPDCVVPVMPADLLPPMPGEIGGPYQFDGHKQRLIVLTQSCDFENNKARFVALCGAYTLEEFESVNPKYGNSGAWNAVAKNRHEALHLLADPNDPDGTRPGLVVDFGELYSLPVGYMVTHAERLGSRWRLISPYTEQLSQRFGNYFSRIALPKSLK